MMWLHEYERLLLDPSTSFQSIVNFKAQHLPASIFRYRPVSERHLNSLLSNEVWLAPPSSFNDGYDSAIKVDHDYLLTLQFRRNFPNMIEEQKLKDKLSESELDTILTSDNPRREFGRILISKEGTSSPESERFLDALGQAAKKVSEEQFQSLSKFTQRGLKVCCFCAIATVPPLWAHYTDNKGFCVEYDLTKIPADNLRLRLLIPVIYGRAPADVTAMFEAGMVQGPNALSVRMPLIAASYKDASWSYEQEWRLVNPDGEDTKGMSLDMPVKAVYLGFSISDDDAAKVSAVARAIKVPIYKMMLGSDASSFISVPA